jgi:N-formylglutamate amidohydrolase
MAFLLDHVLVRHDPTADPVPVVFDSPHSGTDYPPDFDFVCDLEVLREAEDTHVDALFADAPRFGAGLLCALFPRSYIDPNRAPNDLDADLIAAPWSGHRSGEKAHLGMGLIRRMSKPGEPIYDRRLTPGEVRHRLDGYYRPYHRELEAMLDAAHRRFGVVYHINCHSMPSPPAAAGDARVVRPDIVLGDRDGTTCGPGFVAYVEQTLRGLGFSVRRNDPYKGVELVRRHGHPAEGRHALQIEVSRRLYMNERTFERTEGFDEVKARLTHLIAAICAYARP